MRFCRVALIIDIIRCYDCDLAKRQNGMRMPERRDAPSPYWQTQYFNISELPSLVLCTCVLPR